MTSRRLLATLSGAVAVAFLGMLQLRAWEMPWPPALVIATALGAAVLVRPWTAAVGLAAVALTVCTFAGHGQGRLGWPWPATGCAALLALLYLQAAHTPRRRVLATGAVIPVVMLVPAAWTVPLPWGLIVLATAATSLALWLGDNARTRREGQLRLRRESARAAVLEERARIARDLHDVVAHHLSLIALESQSAPLRNPALPADAAGSFAQVHRLAKTGLTEMRTLLRLLRAEDPDLPSLIAQVRASGATVTVSRDADLTGLPAGVRLAAYRIMQESLTNATRHAPGAPITVAITIAADILALTVTNARKYPTTPPPDISDISVMPGSAAGLGMIGMRERAAAVGGTLTAGPTEAGFRVEARLPTNGDAA
jgi:signal transduction histidine kinase